MKREVKTISAWSCSHSRRVLIASEGHTIIRKVMCHVPLPKGLILTHILQSDKIKDEHTRSVGSQELGRANLWERPTAGYASHETSGPSGQQPGGEPLG